MSTNIYIITPSFNAVETIDRTILSVLSQAGDFHIRYHVQDGGSTDGTIDRLIWWNQQVRKGIFRRQAQSIRFTYVSESDGGMYDALVKGFAAVDAAEESFMTWINADDILMPGALALASAMERQFSNVELSWFGGSACIIRDNIVTLSFDRPITSAAIMLGICDGKHWDYLQQEGTFFRKWLWTATNPAKTIADMKLAGDWNLWRMMAKNASFAQISVPLGGFRISKGQLSSAQRDNYQNEINGLISEKERREAFEKYCLAGPIVRRHIKAIQGSTFRIYQESVDGHAKYRYKTVIGNDASWPIRVPMPEKKLFDGKTIHYAQVDPDTPIYPNIMPLVRHAPGLIALDADWQFPAITEQHAYRCLTMDSRRLPEDVLYVAYPWATLIDKIHNKSRDRDLHLNRFEQFCELLPSKVEKVTVCQHIHGQLYIDLFRQARISTVFWTHTTLNDVVNSTQEVDEVRFLPFPLYPVQVTTALPEACHEHDARKCNYLFSFVGARANKYYLSESRNWILDLLANDTRGLVVGRDIWHYQKVVYDHQVQGNTVGSDSTSLVDSSASDQFRELLINSTFSLCPAGSGPNSIRLWESIGAGSIPVILADTWCPPGDRRIWEMGAVFCEETPEAIKALPARLEKIAADPSSLAQMRHAMRQLWILYGPHSFVTDVIQFLLVRAGLQKTSKIIDTDSRPPILIDTDTARQLLINWSSRLLLNPAASLSTLDSEPCINQALEKSRIIVADPSLSNHFLTVLNYARKCANNNQLTAPAILTGVAPKIALIGRHSIRTPLSYEPIKRLIGNRLEWINDPCRADLLVTGFNLDWRENIETLKPLLRRKSPPKLAVISEEPLWDITWSGPFTGRDSEMIIQDFKLSYTFLGHETSNIYNFDQLPYFVLTDDRYPTRYAALMSRFKDVKPVELLQRWRSSSISAAFFAEHRSSEAYSNIFTERDVVGLSNYRSNVAELVSGSGVLCIGKGWGKEIKRQDLPDWHLDKMAQLDGRVRMVGSYENVHMRNYISEKIFDAFAVGGVPVYWAGPKHRIFELVKKTSMINTYELEPSSAASQINTYTPDSEFAESWLDTCAGLAKLFGDVQAIQTERCRVAEKTLNAVNEII